MRNIMLTSTWITIVSIVGSVATTVDLGLLVGGPSWTFAIASAILCPLLLAPPTSHYVIRQHRRIAALLDELNVAHRDLAEQAKRDGLTGLLNRSAFLSTCEQQWQSGREGALILLDADHFKSINDTYGHMSGHKALIAIASAIARLVPEHGYAGRVGGEEFAVFLPRATVDQAMHIAEAIRRGVETSHILGADNARLPITVSIGAAVGSPRASFIELYSTADQRHHEAKHNGRNCVICDRRESLAA